MNSNVWVERVKVSCQDYGGFRHSHWILFRDYHPLRYSTIMSIDQLPLLQHQVPAAE